MVCSGLEIIPRKLGSLGRLLGLSDCGVRLEDRQSKAKLRRHLQAIVGIIQRFQGWSSRLDCRCLAGVVQMIPQKVGQSTVQIENDLRIMRQREGILLWGKNFNKWR